MQDSTPVLDKKSAISCESVVCYFKQETSEPVSTTEPGVMKTGDKDAKAKVVMIFVVYFTGLSAPMNQG